MKNHWNRRQFLRQATAGAMAAASLLPPRLMSAASPNETLWLPLHTLTDGWSRYAEA